MTPECTTEEAYEFVETFLRSKQDLPWKTAKYLARILREQKECRIGPGRLDKLLLDRFAEGPVRYSQFPGRQSLDLLWGHRDNVGDLEQLWDIHLEADKLRDLVGEFEEFQLPEGAEWIFLSHSFADVEEIRTLRRDLSHRGYGVWIAETHILNGEPIVNRVQEGLRQADRFVLYATRQSLGSRWALKEADVARRWKKKPTVIVDRYDDELVELFKRWVRSEWGDDVSKRINQLVKDVPLDPIKATEVPTLLVAALGHVDAGKRQVLLYPETQEERETPERERWSRVMDEVFPRKRK